MIEKLNLFFTGYLFSLMVSIGLRRRRGLLVGGVIFLLVATLYIVGGYFLLLGILNKGFEGHALAGVVASVFTYSFVLPGGVLVSAIIAPWCLGMIYPPSIVSASMGPVLQ